MGMSGALTREVSEGSIQKANGTEMSEPKTTQHFRCGPPKDHECDGDGPFINIRSDGSAILESEAKKLPNWPRGFTGGSVTCSVCGLDSMTLSMWRGEW